MTTPPEHLKRALEALLRSWEIATAADPTATGHWRATTKLIVADALTALRADMTPYEVAVLIIAPAFLGDDDNPVEVIELDDEAT